MKYALVAAVAMVFVGICTETFAEEFVVTVSGIYAKEATFGESFGSQDEAVPVAVELVIDDSKGHYLPLGAPLIDGQQTTSEMLLLPDEAIISASVVLGDTEWSKEDLIPTLPRTDLGLLPTVILAGNLHGDTAQVYFNVHDDLRGSLQINFVKCDRGCGLTEDGWATDIRSGSRGDVKSLDVSVKGF